MRFFVSQRISVLLRVIKFENIDVRKNRFNRIKQLILQNIMGHNRKGDRSRRRGAQQNKRLL